MRMARKTMPVRMDGVYMNEKVLTLLSKLI